MVSKYVIPNFDDEVYDLEDKGDMLQDGEVFLDKVLASKPWPIRPTEEVVNPLPMVSDLGPSLLAVLPDVHDTDVFTMDDLSHSSVAHFSEIVSGFKKVLDYAYAVTPVAEKQHQISKAVVAPLVGFISHEVAHRPGVVDILIVGAGAGKDITRLLKSGVEARVVAIEPDADMAKRLQRFSHVTYYSDTFANSLKYIESDRFDVVIANMSIHYVLGVESSHLFPKYLNKALKPGGVFYGSFFRCFHYKSREPFQNCPIRT